MVKNGDQRRWMFCWRKETATVAKEKRAADCIVMLGGSTTSWTTSCVHLYASEWQKLGRSALCNGFAVSCLGGFSESSTKGSLLLCGENVVVVALLLFVVGWRRWKRNLQSQNEWSLSREMNTVNGTCRLHCQNVMGKRMQSCMGQCDAQHDCCAIVNACKLQKWAQRSRDVTPVTSSNVGMMVTMV